MKTSRAGSHPQIAATNISKINESEVDPAQGASLEISGVYPFCQEIRAGSFLQSL
ncbi:MAG: hypothetical protein JXQ99_04915 [Hyphomicrobiaceae bacterium]